MKGSSLAPRVLRRLGERLVPERMRLRWQSWVHLSFEAAEPELRHVSRLLPVPPRAAIDVGANIGYWSLALGSLCQHVHAFEINPGISRFLRAAALPNVQLHDAGLSSAAGDATLYVPVRDDIGPLYGWASLEPGNCPGVSKHLELPVRIVTLDSCELSNIGFMKIDVEGHELEVLRGGEQTLRRERPNILVEVKERNLEVLRDFMQHLGYEERPVPGIADPGAGGENHFFLPRG